MGDEQFNSDRDSGPPRQSTPRVGGRPGKSPLRIGVAYDHRWSRFSYARWRDAVRYFRRTTAGASCLRQRHKHRADEERGTFGSNRRRSDSYRRVVTGTLTGRSCSSRVGTARSELRGQRRQRRHAENAAILCRVYLNVCLTPIVDLQGHQIRCGGAAASLAPLAGPTDVRLQESETGRAPRPREPPVRPGRPGRGGPPPGSILAPGGTRRGP